MSLEFEALGCGKRESTKFESLMLKVLLLNAKFEASTWTRMTMPLKGSCSRRFKSFVLKEALLMNKEFEAPMQVKRQRPLDKAYDKRFKSFWHAKRVCQEVEQDVSNSMGANQMMQSVLVVWSITGQRWRGVAISAVSWQP